MEHHQLLFMKAQEQTRNPLAWKIGPHLPETLLKTPDERHPDRPTELYSHQVQADDPAILLVQATQPLQNCFPARCSPVESYCDLRQLLLLTLRLTF